MAGERAVFSITTDTDLTDDDQNIDALMGPLFWADTSNTVLTFSFIDSQADYSYTTPRSFFDAFNPAQQATVRKVLDEISDVTPVTFSEWGFGSPLGTLRFAEQAATPQPNAFAPGPDEMGGDVAFGDVRFENPRLGAYTYFEFLQTIGTAMGLKDASAATGPGAMTADRDGMEYSVMSSNSFIGQNQTPDFYTNDIFSFAQTLMMYDIAALQRAYGADFTSNDTDTTYFFSTSIGRMNVNGLPEETPAQNVIFRTIWDGGGTDTYDLSNYMTDLRIDLRPGEYSDFDRGGNAQRALLNRGYDASGTLVGAAEYEWAAGHVYNALQYQGDMRSLIENAIGGSGDDILSGNVAANVLTGNGGDDTLTGEAQNDTLYGGAGNDSLLGGNGMDTLRGDGGDDALTGGVDSDEFQFAAGDGNDTIFGFEPGEAIIVDGMSAYEVRQALSAASETAAGALVDFGNGTTVLLDGIAASTIFQNEAPAVTIGTQTVNDNQWARLSEVIAFSDADGDPISQLWLWDEDGDRNNWYADGRRVDASVGYVTSAAGLSDIWFQGDAAPSTQTLWVRANDGFAWGPWKSFSLVTNGPNIAPVVTIADQVVEYEETTALSDVIGVVDGDGDSIAMYELWDDGGSFDNWYVDGVRVQSSLGYVTSEDAANISFRGDPTFSGNPTATTQTLWVRANDGQAWGAWEKFTLNTREANVTPVVTIADQSVNTGEWTWLSDVIDVADGNGDAVTMFQLWDDQGSTDNWYVGSGYVDAATGYITSSGASDIWFQGDPAASSQTLWVRANDGLAWGAWESFVLTTTGPNTPPTVSIPDRTANGSFSGALDTIMTVSDPDNDTVVSVQLWDDTGENNWFVDGVSVDAGNGYVATNPDDVSLLKSSFGTETFWVRAHDGQAWSAWESFTVTVDLI